MSVRESFQQLIGITERRAHREGLFRAFGQIAGPQWLNNPEVIVDEGGTFETQAGEVQSAVEKEKASVACQFCVAEFGSALVSKQNRPGHLSMSPAGF